MAVHHDPTVRVLPAGRVVFALHLILEELLQQHQLFFLTLKLLDPLRPLLLLERLLRLQLVLLLRQQRQLRLHLNRDVTSRGAKFKKLRSTLTLRKSCASCLCSSNSATDFGSSMSGVAGLRCGSSSRYMLSRSSE